MGFLHHYVLNHRLPAGRLPSPNNAAILPTTNLTVRAPIVPTLSNSKRLLLTEISDNSKGGINEVHQVFPIKEPDLKVVSCQRQRRFYSSISKPSILASTKGFTSQPGRPKYSTETLFNMGKLQIG